MSYGVLLRDAIERLAAAGVPDASRDVRLLWRHCDEDQERFEHLIRRRAAREPVSHLIGQRAFFENDFHISAAVLDPRPETERLVEVALENDFQTVLDLGTGSGCILLSLLAKRQNAMGTGVDISSAALEIAQQNAESLAVSDRCRFVLSDWYQNVSGVYDLIVANPPYIGQAELDGLSPEVRKFEPHIALTDHADGLNAYRAITSGYQNHLALGGVLAVEIGPTQADAVSTMMRDQGLAAVNVAQDLDGRDRVVFGMRGT